MTVRELDEDLDKLAEGDGDIAFALGLRHELGWGVRPDQSKAERYYQQAIELGHAGATYRDWLHKVEAMDVTDTDRASVLRNNFHKLSLAAERGHPKAMLYMAFAYEGGPEVGPDPELMVYWLRKAACAGQISAIWWYQEWVEKGNGTAEDRQKVTAMLRQLSDDGDVQAMAILAIEALDDPNLSSPDREKALETLKKAADGGASIACQRLGWIYCDGLYGFPIDKNRSKFYLDQANKLITEFVAKVTGKS